MKTLALHLILYLASVCGLQGGISATILIPQPIVDFGETETEEWTTTDSPDTDEMYMILPKPFFIMHYNGPDYELIAKEYIMEGAERDCNLLSLHKIKITQEFMSKNVLLDLRQPIPENYSASTLEIAGYAALECIRIVAHRHHHEIALRIAAPVGQEEQWLAIQKKFAAHDKSKPFTRKEQAGTGQPATRPESKSEGSDKPQPESEGRSR